MQPLRHILILAGFGLGATVAIAQGPSTMNIRNDGNRVSGMDEAGHIIWNYRATAPIQVETRADGNYLINGTDLLDRTGHLLTRLAANAGADAILQPSLNPILDDTATDTWGTITTLVAPSNSYVPPVFDDSGNAWTVVTDETNSVARVMKSVGTSGTWQTVATVPYNFGILNNGSIAVDSFGDVTIINEEAVTNGLGIRAIRYQPSTGWSAPEIVYSESQTGLSYPAFTSVMVVADAQGDAIIAGDAAPNGAIYVVYSQAKQLWNAWQQMPQPTPPQPLLPTVFGASLSQSPNRQHIQFNYASATEGASTASGLYTNAFDPSKQTFGDPVLVPKTANKAEYSGNGGDVVLASVDNVGAINVVWEIIQGKKKGTYASRLSSGSKRWAQTLISDQPLELGAFAADSLDAKGDFLVGSPNTNGATEIGELDVIQYQTGAGWSLTTAASWTGAIAATRASVAWLGTSGQAVGVFLLEPFAEVSYHALSSTVFNGSAWSPSFPIPLYPEYYSFFQATASSPSGGQVVLVFDPEDSTATYTVSNVYGTFMLP